MRPYETSRLDLIRPEDRHLYDEKAPGLFRINVERLRAPVQPGARTRQKAMPEKTGFAACQTTKEKVNFIRSAIERSAAG
jgi:hypothetical protein